MSKPRAFLYWNGRLVRSVGTLGRATGGASAIEFALLAPILALVLAATLDFGLVVYIRLSLNQSVSAAANYAMVNADTVSTNGAALANSLAAIIPAGNDVTIVVNNGPTLRRVAGVVSTSGSQSSASACYCPKLDADAMSWGSQVSCGAACAAGGTAGQYVVATAGESYSPMFSGYGIVENGMISVRSIVQVK